MAPTQRGHPEGVNVRCTKGLGIIEFMMHNLVVTGASYLDGKLVRVSIQAPNGLFYEFRKIQDSDDFYMVSIRTKNGDYEYVDEET